MHFKKAFESISKPGLLNVQWHTHATSFLMTFVYSPLFASCAYYDKPADYLSDITRRQINRWCLCFFHPLFSSFLITASLRKDIKGNNRSCAMSVERARGTWWAWRGEAGGRQLLRASFRPGHILTPNPWTHHQPSLPPRLPPLASLSLRAAAN